MKKKYRESNSRRKPLSISQYQLTVDGKRSTGISRTALGFYIGWNQDDLLSIPDCGKKILTDGRSVSWEKTAHCYTW